MNVEHVRGLLREVAGAELLERVEHLDAVRGRRTPSLSLSPPAPSAGDAIELDVIVAGGGLWSLLACVLARRGLRVAVLDRARAAAAHREWNASGSELEALVRCGIVDRKTLDALVVARYRLGTCRFAGGGVYPVTDVLDHAVDAGGLLRHGRALAEARGVSFYDGHAVLSHASSEHGVRVRVAGGAGAGELTARVLVDARGAASPYASADLVCPTVGGVLEGLAVGSAPDEVDPTIGEILATVDGVEDGRQHVWEGFPGRDGQTTVYLFTYARAEAPVSLLSLYGRFFETLPTYKRGEARLVRPTFGFIPGWSRLSPAPRPPDRRVALVGDAAARHSPLTYCGFGAMLRSLDRAADAVSRAVDDPRVDLRSVVDDAPVHSLTGALAHLMASGAFRGDDLNELLDAAFATLHEMGDGPYRALLRDEMPAPAFITFLRRTAARHPKVWGSVVRSLGLGAAGRWGVGIVRALVQARNAHAG